MLVQIKSVKWFSGKIKLVGMLFLLLPMLSFSQQAEYKTIVAKNGDGIHSILKANGLSPEKYSAEFIRINKDKIGKNQRIFIGSTYKLPMRDRDDVPGKEIRTYAIFGEDYKKVEIIDNELQGAVYYLVAGHGGPDPGAVAHYNNQLLCEDEYAYDVTLRLARYLIQHGALVYVITRDPDDGIRDASILKHDKDEYCYPDKKIPLDQNLRLGQRKNIINKLYKKYKGRYQRVVVIHVDSRNKNQDIDVFFYYYKKSKKGKKLCDNLQKTFKEKYARYQPTRGYHGSVSARNLYMLRHAHPVTTYIELGNINHTRDQKRILRKGNRDALAKWLADGLVLDFKNNK